MINSNPFKIVNKDQSTISNNIDENIQSPSFKQMGVRFIKSSVSYIIPAALSIGCGVASGFIVADIELNKVLFAQDYGSFKCFNENEMALDESKAIMRASCMIIAVTSSIISPLLYMVHNRAFN